ncbi:MAG: tetratricopeptide repeat protein [Gemmatimonadaceae bacterium]
MTAFAPTIVPALLMALAAAVTSVTPAIALGQNSAGSSPQLDSVRAACSNVSLPVRPAEAQRRAARDLAARAQEAAIVDDNATARTLYERAEKLDPSDATTAYALARSYETAGDPRALTEYCRFLALAPTDPESADVRQRVASLAAQLAARNAAAVAASVPASSPAQSAGTAFTLGLLFPGLGQYYTHRPGAGVLFTAAATGALLYSTQSRTVTVQTTQTAIDPNGKSYQYQVASTHSEYPNAAAGIAVAASISLIGAIEAYVHARSAGVDEPTSIAQDRTAREPAIAAIVTPIGSAVGFGLSIPVALQR